MMGTHSPDSSAYYRIQYVISQIHMLVAFEVL